MQLNIYKIDIKLNVKNQIEEVRSMDAMIEIDGTYSDVINFAMHQNYVPIIKKIIIKNLSEEDIKDVELVVTTEPDFTYEWKRKIEIIPSLQTIEIDMVNVKLSSNFLYSLTEKMVGTIFIRLRQGEKIICQNIKTIDVLAYDEWSGISIMPEIIAAFITPNNPEIANIVMKSNKILEKWGNNLSFNAYQSNNPNLIKMQIAAIYTTLQNENISYCMPPASYELIGQRVRMCDDIFLQKMGTCLDLSLLYASCLEAVGLNSMIIFIKGHAFVGCWLEDQCFTECVQDDMSMISKRIVDGINQICLVESTCYVAGKNVKFDDAVKLAEDNLKQEDFEFAVDVKRTRGSGIRPIPLRKKEIICDELSNNDGNEKTDFVDAPKKIETFEKINYVDHIDITRQQIWERKLLDLSLKNTLINFRVTKNTIQLMANHLEELEDALASGEEFQIMAKPKDIENELRNSKIYELENQSSILDNLITTEFSNKRIRTFIEENEVAYRITNLYRQAKVSLEENGTNTLYLALGFLKWYESDASEKERYAPIVLIPIDIVRKSVQKGYIIRVRDEEAQMNITLLEMLRQDFGLTIGNLNPLPTDNSGIDLRKVFNIVRQAVMSKSRWDVDELAFIGLFSFSQFVMWNDIHTRSEDLMKNKIVASLVAGKVEWKVNEDFPMPDTLDDTVSPMDLAVPISADSSQLSAICASGKGNSFVLHGPPGTGKSQTITNIIANALFQGKSVLFIAEKMAALSVVQRRLESIGLGAFCLELHSNKAKKRDVLNQLDKVLNIGRIKSPQEYEMQAKRLYELREKLNSVVKAIHKKWHFGFSLYEVITCFEKYRSYSECIKFDQSEIDNITSEKYLLWLDNLKQLKIAGKGCGGAHNNPLKEFKNINYYHGINTEISEELNKYKASILNLQNLVKNISELMGLEDIKTYDKVKNVIELGELVSNIEYIPPKLFQNEELAILKEKVQKVCECGEKRDDIEKQILSIFTKEMVTFDNETALKQWKMAEASWFLPKILAKNKIVKELKAISNDPKQFDKTKIVSYLVLAEDYKINSKSIDDNNDVFEDLFGLIWNNGKADWAIIKDAYLKAVKLNELISKICNNGEQIQRVKQKFVDDIFIDLGVFKQKNSNLNNSSYVLEKLVSIENSFSKKTGINFEELKRDDNCLFSIEEKVNIWAKNLEGLRNWSTYLNIKSKVKEIGLSKIIVAYESGLITEESILPAFYRGVSLAAARYIVDKEKYLTNFNGAIFENEILNYKQTCSNFENLTREELVARLSAKVPTISVNFANSSEIGILQKAIKSGGRMLSIRKLFDSIPNLLRKLSPCMLMSPISVAQYIDPNYPKFDLVVFDEASQLPTCEAVGAMARGNDVIVVGDPKQLPPTNFFNANRIDDDNYEKEDLESILDDCLAISMPQEHLLWHYRSRHESLIAFSNMNYYDNKLFTFPSPNDLVSAVKYVHINGYYDRGKTKQNRAEAEAVVTEIIRRLTNPLLCKDSIGVVTFNSVQQNLIDDLLMDEFDKNTELEQINNNLDESIFIKNLENVQGDERDVILFSVGYGPDAAGNVTLNFGPINRDGGWRRLNVAVSRARKEMIVFSTLRPEQIDLSKTRSQGVAGLKSFLEFAKKGKDSLPVKLSNISSDNNIVEKLIAEKIRTLGYEVNTNIGCSKYKIDIGVVNPNKKGEYILGIMCDGNNYLQANTAKDRNVLQGNVLKSLGWNIYRLWILDWWENQDKELEKINLEIEDAIENLNRKFDAEVINDKPVQVCNYNNLEINRESVAEDQLIKYAVSSLDSVNGGADKFCLSQNNKLIISQIEQVLNDEAPISKNALQRKVMAAWGVTRIGARLDRRFEEIFNIMELNKTVSNNTIFYWDKGQKDSEYVMFRVPMDNATRRNIEDISSEEISNAIKYILDNQISLLKSDLIREVYKLFGYSRSSSTIEETINEGISMAREKNYIDVEDNGRVVVK